jgi:hypothetical protein
VQQKKKKTQKKKKKTILLSPRLQPKKTRKTTQHQKPCPNKQKKLEEKTSYKDYTKPTMTKELSQLK